jgi:hypothetical protein
MNESHEDDNLRNVMKSYRLAKATLLTLERDVKAAPTALALAPTLDSQMRKFGRIVNLFLSSIMVSSIRNLPWP